MEKRTVSGIMLTLLLMTLLTLAFNIQPVRAESTVSINPPSKVDLSLTPGDIFTINITVDYVENLWQWQFELSFNPDVIHGVWYDEDEGHPVEPDPDGFLQSEGGTMLVAGGPGWNNTLGKLWLTSAHLFLKQNPVTGGGVLARVTFEVVGKGETNITLGGYTLLFDLDGYITPGLGHGYFRNVDSAQIPTASFTYSPVGTPEPLEGYYTKFNGTDSTATGIKTIDKYKWYFWKTINEKLLNFDQLKLRPDGDGTYTDWTNNWDDWNDTAASTYVYANAGDMYESSTLQDHATEIYNVGKVRVTIVARNNESASDERVQIMLVIGGTRYYGADYTLTVINKEYTSDWATNPATGSAWTWSDIDSLEAGVRSLQQGASWTGEIRVSQLYIEPMQPPIVDVDVDTIYQNVTRRGTWNVTLTVTDSDGVVATTTQEVTIKAHDVAIINITTDAKTDEAGTPYVYIGELVAINVTVENQGDFAEQHSPSSNFTVTTFYQVWVGVGYREEIIGTVSVTTPLAAGSNTTLTFPWDTAECEISPSTHIIKVNVTAVQYEYDLFDRGDLTTSVHVRELPSPHTHVYVNPSNIVDFTLVPTTQFKVDLYVDYVEPNLLWAYQLTLSFNPDVLHGVSVKNGPFLGSGGGNVMVVPGTGFNNTEGTLSIYGAYLYPIKNFPRGGSDEYGPLATVTFEVVGYGGSPITLGPETGLANRTGFWIIHKKENPEFFFDGYFSNKGVYVDPPRVRGVPVGESFTVNVTAGNLEDVYSWEFYMNWSTPLLNATSMVEGDFLKSQPGGTQFDYEIHNDEGYIYANCTVTGAGTGVTGTGVLANVTFLVEDNGNSILHLYNTLLFNSTSAQIIVDWVDGWFINELHTLTVGSSPVSGIEFTLDGTPYMTPFSVDLEDSYYTVVVPETQRILGKKYGFANWTDGSANRTRVIDLTTDVSLTANYEIIPLPVHNIDIDHHFETIQEAIDAAETLNGHTILVDAGTYYENVLLDKSLKLVGENSGTTIIDGTLSGDVIEVAAENVTITGFTIVNGDYEGIYVDGYDGSLISDNIIANCTWDAIALIFSNNNTISNNVLIQNVFSGIYLEDSNNNTIYGNMIYLNGYSFEWYSSDNNTVVANFFVNGTDGGILLDDCDSNIFYHNNFINNPEQVWISSDSLNNAWNSSYPTGGNYWDDYSGIDLYSGPDQDVSGSDGIGDTLYSIDVDNNDTYPLMNLWGGHVVIDKAVVSDDRCDVGSQQNVSFHAKWALTSSNVTKGIIYVNGTEYSLNGTGWISFNTPAYDTVGKRLWNITGVLVEASSSLNITTYVKAVDDPFIIWDKVNLTFGVIDDRIDVGDTANVTWTGYYEYDLAAFAGTVTFNDTLTKGVVGKYWYTAASISDPAYGLSVFEADSVNCIFDRVQIVISLEDDRIDVGDLAMILWTGTYEYDGSAFEGLIAYNDILTKDVVGGYWYSVAFIIDPAYDLSVFESNSVYCIFDRIQIVISIEDNRIDVGDTADLSWTGTYEFDNSPFEGSITCNDTLSQTIVGKYGYEVGSISDMVYGLSEFTSNAVYVIFDKVTVKLSAVCDTVEVGKAASITWTATYQFDETNFDGAITLNDTLTKYVLGTYYYTTESISGDSYDITVFDSNTIAITVISPSLSIKLTGELDYLFRERIKIRLTAIVTDANTMEPISNATVSIQIFKPDGELWISSAMNEKIPGSGVYEWESEDTILALQLTKGVYLAYAQVSSPGIAADITEFHIDPPAEQPIELHNLLLLILAGIVATVIFAWYKDHQKLTKKIDLAQSNP